MAWNANQNIPGIKELINHGKQFFGGDRTKGKTIMLRIKQIAAAVGQRLKEGGEVVVASLDGWRDRTNRPGWGEENPLHQPDEQGGRGQGKGHGGGKHWERAGEHPHLTPAPGINT